MRIITILLGLLLAAVGPVTSISDIGTPSSNTNISTIVTSTITSTSGNSCVQFTIGPGTGCSWMCNYCATQLQTPNYYFTDGVCTYQEGGCVGNPISGKTYTCCSL